MALNVSVPLIDDMLLNQFLHEITRRSVDGTVPPIFADYKNFKVGIGTTTPLYPLHVAGDIFASGKGILTALMVLGCAELRNVDVPGLGTFNRLGVTGQAHMSSLFIYSANGLTVNGITFSDGTTQSTSAVSSATDNSARLLAMFETEPGTGLGG